MVTTCKVYVNIFEKKNCTVPGYLYYVHSSSSIPDRIMDFDFYPSAEYVLFCRILSLAKALHFDDRPVFLSSVWSKVLAALTVVHIKRKVT